MVCRKETKMKIFGKSGSEILILALPGEVVSQGEYLLIEDGSGRSKLVVQVFNETYLDAPGLAEEIVRDQVMEASIRGAEHDPYEIKSVSSLIRDSRLLHCKARGIIKNGKFRTSHDWLPSRVSSKVSKISLKELFATVGRQGRRAIELGKGRSGEDFEILAETIDGRLNIITGKKESGKSHLAKMLSSSLVELGCFVFIFDINDEYTSLDVKKNGEQSSISSRMVRLVPGESMKLDLGYVGLRSMTSILQHTLDLPGASLREFIRIWDHLRKEDQLTMEELGQAISMWRANDFVKDALFARYHTLLSSRLFAKEGERSIRFEDIIAKFSKGALIVISLAHIPAHARRITIEFMLSKLVDLLEQRKIPPVFLFAEEAHLYLRETHWDDIVTRMRHFGIFTTFITNQPDALGAGVYRQADNVFLFNFTNDADLELISKATTADAETIKAIVRMLPQRSCMTLGKVVSDLPVVVEVRESELFTKGETRLFFMDA
ncbi:MAG: ATP-binding protein [Thaumarchaeota archaeon]|nr:ATP-binding protein [Nitrososphaerota archaeon]